MKRYILLIGLILSVLTVLTAQPAYALEAELYYALHEGTAVYAEKSFDSAILETLEKDAQIQVLSTQTINNIKWCKVLSGNRTGYIASYNLYQKTFTDTFISRYAKITGDKSQADIYIFASPSLEAEKLIKLIDGNRVLLTGIQSGDFLEVEYDGYKGYVPSYTVTRGLTYHQYLAIIVGVVCFAAVVLVFLLAYFNRNKKKP